MAFNNTRTILLHGPRGMEWYCPTPARPPWETDKRHHQEVVRDTTWAAMPFPPTQPTMLGDCATPGWEKRWSWTYIEACNTNGGLTRHFLRRTPQGDLLLQENLLGHTYRILMDAANGVLPAQPNADFPEPHCSQPLISLHCYTWHNDKGEPLEYHYVTYKHPNGSPQLAPKVAVTQHALQKRDGKWCLLPKAYTQVPESWQPVTKSSKNASKENGARNPVIEVLAEAPTAALHALKESASAVKDACAKVVTKVLEAGHSLFTTEPEKTIQEPLDQKHAETKSEDKNEPSATISNYPITNLSRFAGGSEAGARRRNPEQSEGSHLPNYQIDEAPTPTTQPSLWSWTAIQITTGNNNTCHCLRRSPEGRLLLKKELLYLRFSIRAHNVDCLDQAQPSQSNLEEALSLVQVQLDPNNYFVTNSLPGGAPEMPSFVSSTHHLIQTTTGSWCLLPKNESTIPDSWQAKDSAPNKENGAQKPALKANAEEPVLGYQSKESILRHGPKEPPVVVKEAEVNDASKLAQAKQSINAQAPSKLNPDFSNYPITNLSRFAGASKACHPRGEHSEPKGRRRNPEQSEGSHLPNYPISPIYPILEDLENLISDYLVCSPAQRTVLLLWLLHTYTYKSSPITPYLNISSPIEESGKSTCMTVLRSLCAQPWWAAGTSPSVLKNKIIYNHPAVLLDNWHTLFRGSDKQQMTGFLLSGCDNPEHFYDEGAEEEIEHTFCPKAFAGMEPLPPTLARRSIPIILQRRKPQEKVKSTINLAHTTRKFTSWIQTWAEENQNHIKAQIEAQTEAQIAKASSAVESESETQMLGGLTPHQQQSANVLIALAETIGGEWPQKARAALLEIFSAYNGSQVSPIQLLSDIRDAFAHHGNPKCLFTAELLPDLHDLDHRTYDQWNKQGDPMTASALARILYKHFEIYPRTQRRGKKDGKKERFKGYQRADFQEMWECYLPPLESTGETAKEPEQKLEMPRSGSDRPKPPARSQELVASSFVSPNKNAPCHDVTLQKSMTRMPARKSQIFPISQFKSGCQKVLKKLLAKAVGLITLP